MEIRYGTRRFPVTVMETPGTDNNCLGYALGSMLRCEPAELREALCEYLENAGADRDIMACSVIQDFESVPEEARLTRALQELKAGSFIPADVFLSFCKNGPGRRRLLCRNNVVFFAERAGYYEPVAYHLDHVSRATQYIGCDNVHYETLRLSPRHMLQFDVMFFGL